MKYLKMLGLAAVAAMGLMAFLGAGSASATILCETTPAAGTDCGNAWDVAIHTTFDFSLEEKSSALLKETSFPGGFGQTIATCTSSTVKGETENTGGTAETYVNAQLHETLVGGDPEGLTFGGCTNTVTVLKAGTLRIDHESGTDNGTVRSTGAKVTIVAFGINCIYETNETDVGTLTGTNAVNGKDPTFDINAVIVSTNGCPDGIWSGSYVYTGNTTFNVAAG